MKEQRTLVNTSRWHGWQMDAFCATLFWTRGSLSPGRSRIKQEFGPGSIGITRSEISISCCDALSPVLKKTLMKAKASLWFLAEI